MVAREFVNLVARVRFPPHTQHSRARPQTRPLVPKSSGEDARLSTAIGEFDPRRDRSRGGMCQGGELHLQCGCGRFDSGPLHDLQHRRHGDRGAARSPGTREGSVRPRVTARRRCSGVVQWQGAGLWHQLSRFESSHLNAPTDGSDPTLRTSEAWFNSTSGYQVSKCQIIPYPPIAQWQCGRPISGTCWFDSGSVDCGRLPEARMPGCVPGDEGAIPSGHPARPPRSSCHVTRSVSRADCLSDERGSTPLRGAQRQTS